LERQIVGVLCRPAAAIDKKTAKSFGLAVPLTLQAAADEVVE
jgi:hypothetical protein